MSDFIASNLGKIGFDSRQQFFWGNADAFFDWCETNLRKLVGTLGREEKRRLSLEAIPDRLIALVRVEVLNHLESNLSSVQYHEAVACALKNPADLAQWRNCPLGEKAKLPQRLLQAVSKSIKDRRHHLSSSFIREVSEARTRDYLQAWMSADLANLILIALARRELTIAELDSGQNGAGLIALGNFRLNEETWVRQNVRRRGDLAGRGVAHIISKLAGSNDTSFFIKLGQELQRARKTAKRSPETDWEKVNAVARFIVPNWCSWPVVVNRYLPPLCLFENKALAKFCGVALGKSEAAAEVSDKAIRKWVSRLGLHHSKTPKVREVKVGKRGLLFLPM